METSFNKVINFESHCTSQPHWELREDEPSLLPEHEPLAPLLVQPIPDTDTFLSPFSGWIVSIGRSSGTSGKTAERERERERPTSSLCLPLPQQIYAIMCMKTNFKFGSTMKLIPLQLCKWLHFREQSWADRRNTGLASFLPKLCSIQRWGKNVSIVVCHTSKKLTSITE